MGGDGRLVQAQQRATSPVISPRDGAVLTEVPDGTSADIDRAVAAARRAVEDSAWSRLSPAERKAVLHRPVLSVLTAADIDVAVAMANDTESGLAASVWTRDVSLAHRVSRRLRAGTMWVNCYEEGDMTVPFGGYKQSGNGRDKSAHALEKYTELKTTWIAL